MRGQGIWRVGLEDFEPIRRLGRALYDPEPRCGVEKSCLEHCGCPPLARCLIGTVREDDERAGKPAMGAWRLQGTNERVRRPKRRSHERTPRVVKQGSRLSRS